LDVDAAPGQLGRSVLPIYGDVRTGKPSEKIAMICFRCEQQNVAETDGGKQWCSWCNDWALTQKPATETKQRHQSEEWKLNRYLPFRRSPGNVGGKDWQKILSKLTVTDAKPEHHSPGKITSPYYSVETYSDVAAMVIRISELEAQSSHPINVYPTYIEAYLSGAGNEYEKFYRVARSMWQHEIYYEFD
jgi:hypothetical protein